jgi:hypothetical protein
MVAVFALEELSKLCHTLMSNHVRSRTYLGGSGISMAQFIELKLLFVKQKAALQKRFS